jgi:hypothetical protein
MLLLQYRFGGKAWRGDAEAKHLVPDEAPEAWEARGAEVVQRVLGPVGRVERWVAEWGGDEGVQGGVEGWEERDEEGRESELYGMGWILLVPGVFGGWEGGLGCCGGIGKWTREDLRLGKEIRRTHTARSAGGPRG